MSQKPIKRQKAVMPWDKNVPWTVPTPIDRQATEVTCLPLSRQSTVVAPEDYEIRAALTEETLKGYDANMAMARKVADLELKELRDALKRAERAARDVRTHLLLLQIASEKLPLPQKALIKISLETLSWVIQDANRTLDPATMHDRILR